MTVNTAQVQRWTTRIWPLVLIALVVVMPFAVKKAYDEKRAAGEI